MTEADYRARVLESVRESCHNMARFRGVTYLSMLRAHADQCAENLHDSLRTTAEGYWRFRLEVCEQEAATIERSDVIPRG